MLPVRRSSTADQGPVMGPGLLLLFVVGDILGTGVYALTGKIAGWLMLVGVGLWAITWLLNKYVFKRHADFDPTHLDPQGPVN